MMMRIFYLCGPHRVTHMKGVKDPKDHQPEVKAWRVPRLLVSNTWCSSHYQPPLKKNFLNFTHPINVMPSLPDDRHSLFIFPRILKKVFPWVHCHSSGSVPMGTLLFKCRIWESGYIVIQVGRWVAKASICWTDRFVKSLKALPRNLSKLSHPREYKLSHQGNPLFLSASCPH